MWIGMGRIGTGLLMAVGLAGLATAASAVQPAALRPIAAGRWQLTEIGGTGSRLVCLADPAQALQVAHGDARCSRTLLDASKRAVTVDYSCPGRGRGRSTLTVRTAQSFRLETQGMSGGAPFAIDYDASRVGDCAGAHATAARLTDR